MIQSINDKDQKESICRDTLTALPEWFEIPESIEDYAYNVRNMPLWADVEGDECCGFAALRETSPYAVEVYVMGVKKQYHRCGIGTLLLDELCRYARAHGYEYIHVKTVESGYYDDYDKTNDFYRSYGFRELECLKALWGEENPCQLYVMAINN